MDNFIVCTHNCFSYEELFNLLIRFDNMFVPPFSQCIDLSKYTNKLLQHASFVYCMSGKNIISLLAYYKNNVTRELYIPYICVENSKQNTGIGKKMMNTLIENNREYYNSIVLEVVKSNVNGLSFYFRNGFVIEEERLDRYLLRKKM